VSETGDNTMPDQDFEIKFSKLVNGMIAEKVPALNKYKVGFQILTKDDDGTKAAGINAFVVNNVWVYIPVFFMDGAISGLELMYIKQNDVFVPAKDNWVASIKSQGEDLLGKMVEESEIDADAALDSESVSFTDKVAFRRTDDLLTKDDLLKMMRILPENKSRTFIDKVANMGHQALHSFVSTLHKSPDFANAVLKFHNPKELQKVAEVAKDMVASEVVNADTNEVKLISSMTDSAAKSLSDAEKKMLVQNGVFVQDNRKSFSKLFEQKVRSDVCQNPTSSGIYDVLLTDGTYITSFIVMLGIDKYSCNSNKVAIITFAKPDIYYVRPSTEVFCKVVENVTADDVKKLISGEPVTKKTLVNIRGEYSGTALLTQGAKTNLEVCLDKYMQGDDDQLHGRIESSRGINKHRGSDCEVTVEFTEKPGLLSVIGNTLYIPDDVRIFKKAKWEEEKAIKLGNLSTIHSAIIKEANLQPLYVSSIGNLVQVRSGKGMTSLLDKVAAIKHLVVKEGIFAGQAQQLLKEASRNSDKVAKYYIRYAPAYMMKLAAQGESGPVETTAVVGGKALVNDLPKAAIDKVVRASEAGVKEVFDTKVLQQLLDVADVSELRKDFITDMIKGMDKIGRMLFLFYWHNEEFAERYGEEDLDSLEDSLKQTFDMTGDLVLFLKEKMANVPNSGESMFGALSEDIGTTDATV
jgi:hypothetical protein